ncbi:MAG: VWA domain-containing protein [Chloroflexi bacterium]|nr:VWA domain-containing protein [Chloroflexota bacterium]
MVLLDGSASMQATDVAPNRFEAAKVEINRLINDLGGDNQMTLIHVGYASTVLVSAASDKTVLRRALAEAQPTTATPNWEAALALAAGAARVSAMVALSSCRMAGCPPICPLPTTPVYLPVGESGENLAISAPGNTGHGSRAAVVCQRGQ